MGCDLITGYPATYFSHLFTTYNQQMHHTKHLVILLFVNSVLHGPFVGLTL